MEKNKKIMFASIASVLVLVILFSLWFLTKEKETYL